MKENEKGGGMKNENHKMRSLVSKEGTTYFKTYSVNIWLFPGLTPEDITDYLRPTMRNKPNAIIIDAGPNDLSPCDDLCIRK